MYILKREIVPGTVLWGERKIYYDKPDKKLNGKRSMYVVTMVNDEYFFGCPLTVNDSIRNSTVLKKKYYPIKHDSRITECIYKLDYSDIVSSSSFRVAPKTFEHFKRNLYKRILIGQADGFGEYNETYIQDYLSTHIPEVDNIIVYPSEEKKLKYYYLYDMDDENYSLLRLRREGNDCYLDSTTIETIPKDVRFFEYFTNHSTPRPSIEELRFGGYQKSLGTKN